jgi:hypothetical protein
MLKNKDDIAKASSYSSPHLSVGFLAAGVVRFSSVLPLSALAVSSPFFLPYRESFFYDFINRFLSELGCKNYLQLIGTNIWFWEGRQFLHFCFATKICITEFHYRNLVTL